MPDTGAPWNIPYAAPADLVSAWPALSEDIAEAIADGLDAAGNAGIGSNVVQATSTSRFTTASTTFVAVTGMNVTITPTSASSKVLVVCSGLYGNASNSPVTRSRIVRGASQIAITEHYNGGANGTGFTYSILDSPATTSATTYGLELLTTNASFLAYFNAYASASGSPGFASITAIEVAA
jgi:hypothetical protein